MKDFISLLDYPADALTGLLDEADALQARWLANDMPPVLRDRRIGLWFHDHNWKQVAFELGVQAMGGTAVAIPVDQSGQIPAGWFSLLVVNEYDHERLAQVARQAGVPVINAGSNHSDPATVLGHLQYIRRRRGGLDGLRVAIAGQVTGVCRSWFEAATRWPISVTQVAPEGRQADAALVRRLNDGAAGQIAVTTDVTNALDDADVLIVNEWPGVSHPRSFAELKAQFLPYQIELSHLQRLTPNAIFLPAPSVTPGREVTEDALQSSLNQTAAAQSFTLHAQNAILKALVEANQTAQ